MSKPKAQFNTPTETPISHKGSPAGEGFNPPSESKWPKGDNSGLADREAEFEFPVGKKTSK
jgi:hypothetical protein